jgi:hypothetical protein
MRPVNSIYHRVSKGDPHRECWTPVVIKGGLWLLRNGKQRWPFNALG